MTIDRSAIVGVILIMVSLMPIQMALSSIITQQDPEYLTTTDMPTQDIPLAKLFRCYCNLPECMTSNTENNTCITSLGCFSELQAIMPELLIYDNCTSDNTSTQCFITTTPTVTMETPVPEDDTDETVKFVLSSHNMNGSYGCLELIPTNKTCDEILRNLDYNDSEFPRFRELEINSTNDVIRAYHCCQDDMCNDHLKVVTRAKAIQNSIWKIFTNSNNTYQTVQEELLTYSELPQWSPILTIPDNISATTNDFQHLLNSNITADIPSNYPASQSIPTVLMAEKDNLNNGGLTNRNKIIETTIYETNTTTKILYKIVYNLSKDNLTNMEITDIPIDGLNHPSLSTEQIMSTTNAVFNNNTTKLISNNTTETIKFESPITQGDLQAHLVFEQHSASLKHDTINSSTNILEHLLMTASLDHDTEVNIMNSNEAQEIIESVPIPIPAALKSQDDELINGNLNIINKSTSVDTLMSETNITTKTPVETVSFSLPSVEQYFTTLSNTSDDIINSFDNSTTKRMTISVNANATYNSSTNVTSTSPNLYNNTILQSNITSAHIDNVTVASTYVNTSDNIIYVSPNATDNSVILDKRTIFSNTTGYSITTTNVTENYATTPSYVNISNAIDNTIFNANMTDNHTLTTNLLKSGNKTDFPISIKNTTDGYANIASYNNFTNITVGSSINHPSTQTTIIITNDTSDISDNFTTEATITHRIDATESTSILSNTTETTNINSTSNFTESGLDMALNDIEIDENLDPQRFSHVINRRHDNQSANGLQEQQNNAESITITQSQEDTIPQLDVAPNEFPMDKEQDDASYHHIERSTEMEQHRLPAALMEFYNWLIGFTGLLAIFGVVVVSFLVAAAIKILRKAEVFTTSVGLCRVPGQPCPCMTNIGLLDVNRSHSRINTITPSSGPDNPTFPASTNGENINNGYNYTDSTGTTTYVYTKIPVSTPVGAQRH